MKRFTVANPDSLNVRKSPLLPALILMTMTSFTSPTNTVNFCGPMANTRLGSSAMNGTREGWCLFEQDMKKRKGGPRKEAKLAKLKGVTLPLAIVDLPDKTIDFLNDQDITPDFINPTSDGSLMIEFTTENKYHAVEFYPDGEIVFLKRGDEGTDIWALTNETYMDKLKEELSLEIEAEPVE